MSKRKKAVLIFFVLISLIIIDRQLWMQKRIEGLFLWESGPSLGDPIAFNQDFYLEDSRIKFKEYKNKDSWPETEKNRNSELYFVGCYLGNLYIYNIPKEKLIVYSRK